MLWEQCESMQQLSSEEQGDASLQNWKLQWNVAWRETCRWSFESAASQGGSDKAAIWTPCSQSYFKISLKNQSSYHSCKPRLYLIDQVVGAQVPWLIHAALLMTTTQQGLVRHSGLPLEPPIALDMSLAMYGHWNGAVVDECWVAINIFVMVRNKYCTDHWCNFNSDMKAVYYFRTLFKNFLCLDVQLWRSLFIARVGTPLGVKADDMRFPQATVDFETDKPPWSRSITRQERELFNTQAACKATRFDATHPKCWKTSLKFAAIWITWRAQWWNVQSTHNVPVKGRAKAIKPCEFTFKLRTPGWIERFWPWSHLSKGFPLDPPRSWNVWLANFVALSKLKSYLLVIADALVTRSFCETLSGETRWEFRKLPEQCFCWGLARGSGQCKHLHINTVASTPKLPWAGHFGNPYSYNSGFN